MFGLLLLLIFLYVLNLTRRMLAPTPHTVNSTASAEVGAGNQEDLEEDGETELRVKGMYKRGRGKGRG